MHVPIPSLEDRQIRSAMDSLAARHPDREIPGYYYAEGFLFAVACVPDLVMPSHWLEALGVTRNLDRCTQEETEPCIAALMALYNRVNEAVMEDDVEGILTAPFASPVQENTAEGCPVQQWTLGYWRGFIAFLLQDIFQRESGPGPWDEIEERVFDILPTALGAINYFASEEGRQKFHADVPPENLENVATMYAEHFQDLLRMLSLIRTFPALPEPGSGPAPGRRHAPGRRKRKGKR